MHEYSSYGGYCLREPVLEPFVVTSSRFGEPLEVGCLVVDLGYAATDRAV